MRISVVIPTLNEAANIESCLTSVRDAGVDQVLVVDAGSTDNTLQIAAQFQVEQLQCGPGRARQQNFGSQHATGDVLLFLHADCQLAPDTGHQVRTAFADPDTVAGGFRQSIQPTSGALNKIAAGNAARIRWLKWVYGDQGLFVRKAAFERAGGFPDLSFMEDLYFTKRIKKFGKVVLAQGPLQVSARRWQHKGVVRQTLRNWSLITAAHLGVSPNRLVAFYTNVR